MATRLVWHDGDGSRRHLASRLGRGVLLGLLALTWAQPSRALTDEEVFRSVRLTTLAPGARALGMGGAFIGLSDDGTASYLNPGGLGFLDRPQVMVDLRLTDIDDLQVGVPGAFDLAGTETYASGVVDLEEENIGAPAYLSYVHPVWKYLVVGISRHERSNFERDVAASFSSNAFPPLEGGGAGVVREALGTRGNLDVLMDTWNLSLSSAVLEQLSLGVTVSAARLDMVSTIDNFRGATSDNDGDALPDKFASELDYRTVVDDDDVQFTFTAGLLYRPHPNVGLGLVYRDGPEFEVVEAVQGVGSRAAELREYLVAAGIANLEGEFINTMSFPDSYGGGVSFGPFWEGRGGGGLTVTADAVRVEYSDMLDSFVAGLNNQMFASDSQGVRFEIDDGTEYHLGIDWGWTVGYNNNIHVRAGVWSEPERAILSSGRLTAVVDPINGGLVRPGRVVSAEDDEIHVSIGGGFMLKRGFYAFQLDGSADFSDVGSVYTGSATFKF